MKKIILIIALCFLSISTVAAFDTAECEQKTFTVTAYYSPMSGQAFYYTPTYETEVILNGAGIAGASGKKVFTGMLAAPASYLFGQKIYFPSLGWGEVADRGGAIVFSWEKGQIYDRIDIWMGRGEEWLVRALVFGKKTLTGYLCAQGSKPSIDFASIPVYKNFFDIALRIQQLDKGRNDIWVRTLQKYLVSLWYLHKSHRHGSYDAFTKKALCAYQVSKKLVSAKHTDCGVFGSRTRYTMKLDMQSKGKLPDNLYTPGTLSALLELARYYNGKPQAGNAVASTTWSKSSSTTSTPSSSRFAFYKAYTKGQQSSEIKILQTFLRDQGLYSGKIDGVYTSKTLDAVYAFQQKYTLISSQDSLAVQGYLGPKTRNKINQLRNI